MVKQLRKRSEKVGYVPGSLIYLGKKRKGKISLNLFDYNAKTCIEKKIDYKKKRFPFKKKSSVTWINIDGLHDVSVIEKIGSQYDIHPLTLEDILNTDQRPKIEIFDDYILIILKMLYYDDKKKKISSEQVSIILGDHYVISFQETKDDIFDPIRHKLRQEMSKIRDMPSDYLMHAILDIIVDNYFIILEQTGEKIAIFEEELMNNPRSDTLKDIYRLKREILFLRRAVWPLREVISKLEKSESALINKQTEVFFRDLYDHVIQVIDNIENFRDLTSGMLDLYLSSISNKTNEVMKVLTIISTIFIPLTFITGIYGMNFHNFPELGWKWGYFTIWGVILLIAFTMILFFKKKKWL